ncbi:MAG TPA: 30S ribosomal protein S13 [Candidatus Saccharimonadales bacterium]|nr:30S ribosomal protein S13 [Candidatus Saccharimonadales bacterium]
MMRIVGVTIPDEKKVNIALAYIYGIGRKNVGEVLIKAEVDGEKRAKTLTEDEIKRLTKVLEAYKIEGDLKADIAANIRRLRDIGSYRGLRHAHGLPARGQRTRSNARTKRGKRMTIGAIKKEVIAKMEQAQKAKTTGK